MGYEGFARRNPKPDTVYAERAFIKVQTVLHIHQRASDANVHRLKLACIELCRENRETVALAYSDSEGFLVALRNLLV